MQGHMIIGITGTLGAGKGTVVEYLVEKKGFAHFSVRQYLTGIIKRRDLPLNRDSMVAVANELRAAHSPSHIVQQLYEQAARRGGNVIIESIRTPGEVDALKMKKEFLLLAVDAEVHTRYERVCQRASETDNIDFETFVANEQREMHNEDPAKQNIAACMEMADIRLSNDDTKEQLYARIEDVLTKVKKHDGEY
ncbi:MAG: AAA family ATPase [Nanoarchaeota archaeon]